VDMHFLKSHLVNTPQACHMFIHLTSHFSSESIQENKTQLPRNL
jgi:hypothetical protein